MNQSSTPPDIGPNTRPNIYTRQPERDPCRGIIRSLSPSPSQSPSRELFPTSCRSSPLPTLHFAHQTDQSSRDEPSPPSDSSCQHQLLLHKSAPNLVDARTLTAHLVNAQVLVENTRESSDKAGEEKTENCSSTSLNLFPVNTPSESSDTWKLDTKHAHSTGDGGKRRKSSDENLEANKKDEDLWLPRAGNIGNEGEVLKLVDLNEIVELRTDEQR